MPRALAIFRALASEQLPSTSSRRIVSGLTPASTATSKSERLPRVLRTSVPKCCSCTGRQRRRTRKESQQKRATSLQGSPRSGSWSVLCSLAERLLPLVDAHPLELGG